MSSSWDHQLSEPDGKTQHSIQWQSHLQHHQHNCRGRPAGVLQHLLQHVIQPGSRPIQQQPGSVKLWAGVLGERSGSVDHPIWSVWIGICQAPVHQEKPWYGKNPVVTLKGNSQKHNSADRRAFSNINYSLYSNVIFLSKYGDHRWDATWDCPQLWSSDYVPFQSCQCEEKETKIENVSWTLKVEMGCLGGPFTAGQFSSNQFVS